MWSGGMNRRVDQSALRTNQSFIIGLLFLSFVLDLPLGVAFVSAVMLIGTVIPQAALFKLIYLRGLKPAGIVKPDVIEDNPEPHNFSQGLGGIFTLLATLALVAGAPLIGWVLTGIVIALAALNLLAGFCVGCFIYYQLSQRNVPGFTQHPLNVEQG
jgi:amino acid transporter